MPADAHAGNEVSDTQKVAAAWVLETRIVKLIETGPRLTPVIMTNILPIALTFDCVADDTIGSVEEKTPVISP